MFDEQVPKPFAVTFELGPHGIFGLPEPDTTVVPGGSEVISRVIAEGTDQFVGHGTLSKFRPDEAALDVGVDFGKSHLQIRDNYLTVYVDAASDSGEAWERAQGIVERYLQHVSLAIGRTVRARGLTITLPDGRMIKAPWLVSWLRLTTYNLGQMNDALLEAGEFGSLSDDRLNRALEYYDLALTLFEGRERLADINMRQHREVIAASFLNLWKAMTTIVGDPSRDRDYQSRYKALGFDHAFYEGKIRPLQELRDKYDVAHSSLDHDAAQRVAGEFSAAQSTVQEIVRGHRARLAEQASA